jgi:hypothetical protein
MAMSKFYVLFYDGQNIYFPVKAELNPYNGRPAYCGGFPQFFGGKPDGGETVGEALTREVLEESIATYALNPGSLPLIYEGNVGGDHFVHGGFFCSRNFTRSTTYVWPATENDWEDYRPPYREMCGIASASIQTCLTALNMPPGLRYPGGAAGLPRLPALANTLTQAALATLPQWAQGQVSNVTYGDPLPTKGQPGFDFLTSETLVAFGAFFMEWNARTLPVPSN